MNGVAYRPGYIVLHRSGELRKRGEALWEMLSDCRFCPRECKVNRLAGETGFCKVTDRLKVASYSPHFGEESPLVGVGGSGTIFLSHCNLGCVFCQNWDISHKGVGTDCKIDDLAASKGLRLPLVYNTSGWERPLVLELLDGIVDIYLADFKYMDARVASDYSGGAEEYPRVTRSALLEMDRQVGTAQPEHNGVVYRGVMIRHLVMPANASSSMEAMHWIARNLPAYRAHLFPEIDRYVSRDEYTRVVDEARKCGLTNLDADI